MSDPQNDALHEMAIEKIEEQRAEIERLRDALERITRYDVKHYKQKEHAYCSYRSATDGMKDIAREALKGDSDE